MKRVLVLLAFVLFFGSGFSQEIFYDGFESGDLNNWVLSYEGACSNQWAATTTSPLNETYSAYVVNVDCQTIMNRTQDLTGYFNTSLNVSFSIKTVGLDAGECLNFSYSNGSVWTKPLSLCATNLPYQNYTYLLTTNSNRSSAQFSFRCFSSANAETCQVDDFRIHGTQMGEAPPSGNVTIISFNYPADASTNTTTQTIQFGYTPVFYGGKPTNCSLYTNKTGTWSWTSANATAITNNSLNTITYNFGTDTVLNWSIGCFNNQNLNFTKENRSLTINTEVPPMVHGIYAGSDPLTLSTAMQHEPSSAPMIWAQVRNSSGAGISGKTVTLYIYDANRNERSIALMPELKGGLYYYNSHTLSANDNGTFMLFANTTENGVNVTAMTTFLVRAFASGSGGGGLDANQNTTLYKTYENTKQINATLNTTVLDKLETVLIKQLTMAYDVWAYAYNYQWVKQDVLGLGVWNYTGVRNLSTFNNLVVDIWSYTTRTLSDYNGVWSVASRTLSDVSNVWSYATRTLTSSAGLDVNQNATLYQTMWYGQQINLTTNKSTDQSIPFVQQINATLNKTVVPKLDSIITTLSTLVSDIWSYGTKTLTSFGSLVSDVWNAGTRTLTGFDFKVVTSGGNITNVTNPIYCANCSSGGGTTAQQVWEYSPRNLTMNFSNITNFYNNYSTYNITNVYNLTSNITNYIYNYTADMVCMQIGYATICSPKG